MHMYNLAFSRLVRAIAESPGPGRTLGDRGNHGEASLTHLLYPPHPPVPHRCYRHSSRPSQQAFLFAARVQVARRPQTRRVTSHGCGSQLRYTYDTSTIRTTNRTEPNRTYQVYDTAVHKKTYPVEVVLQDVDSVGLDVVAPPIFERDDPLRVP